MSEDPRADFNVYLALKVNTINYEREKIRGVFLWVPVLLRIRTDAKISLDGNI